MTLPETMDKENTTHSKNARTMGHFLMLCVKQAIKRGGVHCGMASCAQLLKLDSTSAMFCLLPASCDQLSLQIHHTLIKAFCHERNIPVILINNERHLATLIKKVSAKGKDRLYSKVMGNAEDMNCVLIQKPGKRMSKFDHELIQCYNHYMDNGIPMPAVDVPA